MVGSFGVRVAGPLERYAAGFAAELTRLGYTFFSARDQLRLVAHLSRWLDGGGLDAAGLTPAVVAEFLVARRVAGYTAWLSPKAMAPLLGYLRGLGVAPPPVAVVPATVVEELLERYRGYLLVERGVQVEVAGGYLELVRPFVAGCAGAGGVRLGRLTGGEVSA